MQERRLVGIDYGRRRIGIAVSDLLRITAQPLLVLDLKDQNQAVSAVCKVLAEIEVERVILGWPISPAGSGGQMAAEVESFAEKLRARGYQVELVDERFTSREAKAVMHAGGRREKQMRGKLDSIAAQLILQSYMDENAGGK